MVFISFSCILTGVPYLIYGPGTHLLHMDSAGVYSNKTNYQLCLDEHETNCDDHDGSSTIWPAYIIIWMASFLNGIGYTAFYTLGYPYVDDNVSKKNAPLYFSKFSSG